MEKDKKDIFLELAKVKKQPPPLQIQKDSDENFNEDDGQLTIDVYKNSDDEIVVQSTVAGVDPDNLEINITNESVTIRGKRERSEKIEDKDFFYQECFWGSFSRSVILPEEVDADKSVATFKNGVLTIRLPKLDRKKQKKIKIKAED